MYLKQPKIRIVVEIDQSRYLGDEDYGGIQEKQLVTRVNLGNLLEGGHYDVKISLESEDKS